MKLVTIKDILRKDTPIFYRMFYKGIAVIELKRETGEYRIDFVIEVKPTGHVEISVTIVDAIEYPLLPLLKELKSFINDLYRSGELSV